MKVTLAIFNVSTFPSPFGRIGFLTLSGLAFCTGTYTLS